MKIGLVFVTPLPGTYYQRGGHPVRQPRISGRTSQQCNMMEIITQSGTKSATNGLQGHQGMKKYQAKHGSGQSLTGSGRRLRQRLGAAPIHRHLAGLLILARSCSISWLRQKMIPRRYLATITRPVCTLNMHSARIATYYKQSNNHATRYTLEIKSYNMARCTLDT